MIEFSDWVEGGLFGLSLAVTLDILALICFSSFSFNMGWFGLSCYIFISSGEWLNQLLFNSDYFIVPLLLNCVVGILVGAFVGYFIQKVRGK